MGLENRVNIPRISIYREEVNSLNKTYTENRVFSTAFGETPEWKIDFTQGQLDAIKVLYENKDYRELLATAMRSNTPNKRLEKSVFGSVQDRPMSANYFLRENGELLVQSGSGDKKGEHAVHLSMMQTETFKQEEIRRSFQRSGHVWKINNGKTQYKIALFDSVDWDMVRGNDFGFYGENQKRIMRILTAVGYVCVTTEGYPAYPLGLYKKLTERLRAGV